MIQWLCECGTSDACVHKGVSEAGYDTKQVMTRSSTHFFSVQARRQYILAPRPWHGVLWRGKGVCLPPMLSIARCSLNEPPRGTSLFYFIYLCAVCASLCWCVNRLWNCAQPRFSRRATPGRRFMSMLNNVGGKRVRWTISVSVFL